MAATLTSREDAHTVWLKLTILNYDKRIAGQAMFHIMSKLKTSMGDGTD